ncbi:MAG: Gam protein [Clostridiaceae bacterium]|jgi:5'-3' exonuclease|nr:Gam protein [Clostridiaceae bacterium]
MNKNFFAILTFSIIFLGLILSNLFFVRKTFELNEQLTRIYELEDTINQLKAEHRKEINEIKADYENQVERINNEYSEKFDTVTKALNAFEYEIEEFYKNKFIMKEDYLENIKKINDVRAKLEDSN